MSCTQLSLGRPALPCTSEGARRGLEPGAGQITARSRAARKREEPAPGLLGAFTPAGRLHLGFLIGYLVIAAAQTVSVPFGDVCYFIGDPWRSRRSLPIPSASISAETAPTSLERAGTERQRAWPREMQLLGDFGLTTYTAIPLKK